MPDSATPTGVSNTLGYLTISIFQKGFSKLNFRVKLGFQFQLLFNCQRHFRVAIKLDRLLRLIKKFQLTKLCSLVQAQNIELFLTRRVEQKQIYWLNRLRGQSSNRSSRVLDSTLPCKIQLYQVSQMVWGFVLYCQVYYWLAFSPSSHSWVLLNFVT